MVIGLLLLALLQCFAGATKTSALYALSNSATNEVYVYGVNLTSGEATYLSSVGTQGAGNGAPHSQGSLVTSGNYLIAANGGDNSISLFWIDPKNATSLTFLDKTPVNGSFPTTIAATSAWGNTACVVTTYGPLMLSCYHFSQAGFKYDPAWTRDLGVNWTNAAAWPTSQVSFSPKLNFLVIQFKGLPFATLVFPITNNALAATPISINASTPLGPNSYGFVWYGDDIIVTTDAAIGIVLYRLASNGSLAEGNSVNPPNTTAYCWMAYSWLTNRPYAIAAGTANVTEITISGSNLLGVGAATWVDKTTYAPLTEGVVVRGASTDYLYVLSKAGITLWPIAGKNQLTYDDTVAYPGGGSGSVWGLASATFDTSGASVPQLSLLIFVLAFFSTLIN